MANVRTNAHSFNGGELTAEFFGQIGDAKYQTGLALCRNFVAKPQGPAENRAGFAYVRAVKDSSKKTRLIPFTYSTTQTFAIEVGAGYFRFHTLGATLLAGSLAAYSGATAYVPGSLVSSGGVNYYCTAATTGNAPPNASYWYAMPSTGEYQLPNSYTEADLFDIHYVQSADVLTLAHPNYAPAELRRLGATNWTLSNIVFTPTIAPPSSVTGTAQGFTTAKYSYQYVITALAADGISESIQSNAATGNAKAITAATQAAPCVVTAVAHGLAVGDAFAISGVVGMTQLNGTGYTINQVLSADTFSLKDGAGNVVISMAFGAYSSGGTVTPSVLRGNVYEAGATNSISWTAVSGASRYYVYKRVGGSYGYIGQTTGLNLVDDNIAPDLSRTPPTYDTSLQSAGNYPAAVSYFEQRRVFAGTVNQPQNIWMTRSGTESALNYSIPIRDDDRIAFRVAAREANTIRHIVPLTNLVILTSAAEWRVSSVNSDAITPSSISVKPQSYIGANNAQPVIINNNLLYGAARGGHMREMAYSWQANGFQTGDLSLRSPHLFDGYELTDIAYAKAPIPIVWAISSSGKLLGLTYVPEQQVGSWHQHDTDGTFESCAVVSEGSEDVLYTIVKRTVNGSQVRYVERMASRRFDTPSDAFFVDAGATYNGAPTLTITGLTWLEGKTVNILSDGVVHNQRVVTGGAITLDHLGSKVQIGLPITADIQTLPLAAQFDAGFGQGRQKNINKVFLRVYKSGGILAGPSADRLVEFKPRSTEVYGAPPDLKTEELEIVVKNDWGDSAQLFIRQTSPLPLTLVSLTMDVAIGG
jgi:hypothetical protein